MADQRIRQLKIKTGVVKRVTKEMNSYKTEVEQDEKKIEKMKEEGKDEYDIKKQGEVLQESLSMIPDSERRLAKYMQELKSIMDEVKPELEETDEFKAAVTVYEEGEAANKTPDTAS